MTRNETEKLFTLLEQFWPNKKASGNKKAAWALALEPYEYEAIKAAAVRYATQNKFFPDLADLTLGLRQKAGQNRDDLELLKKILSKGESDGSKA